MARYESRLRAEQAAGTRQRVIGAAAELFAQDGFRRTTLTRIAAGAGVSVETVQAQGSKRSLLSAAVHQLSFGDPGVDFFSAPESAGVRDATGPAEFAHHGARLVAEFNSRTHRLWRAFVSAAADDPDVDRELSELSGLIREQCRGIAAMLADRGWARPDVPARELGDGLWLLVGAENYERAVVRLGWSHEEYVRWLTRTLRDTLLVTSG